MPKPNPPWPMLKPQLSPPIAGATGTAITIAAPSPVVINLRNFEIMMFNLLGLDTDKESYPSMTKLR
jgi:hypothetical protein